MSRPKLTTGLLLAGLMVLVYFRWMNFEIFTYGDWSYKSLDTLRETATPFAWVGGIGFGSFNEFIWRMPLDVLFGLFALVGLSINISDKFLIFWPLIITTVAAPYMLVKEITARRSAALAATLFYATNTYFLAINSQGHQLLPLAFNVLTIAFAMFIRAMRAGEYKKFIIAALLLFVSGFIDFRVCYIGIFLIGIYALAFWPRRENKAFRRKILRRVALFFGITAGLQLYWVLAFGLNYGTADSEVLARSLFGNSYWDLASVVTLHHPFWDGTTTTWFVKNAVPWFFWFVPLLALWGFLLRPRSKYLVFFLATAIVGILLGKQVSEPLRNLYPFLFDHFPGFSAFREATKFYYLTLLGYSVLLGYLVMRLYDARPKEKLHRFGRYAVIGGFVFLCGLNAWPYISGSMGRLLTARKMPGDYSAFEQQLSKEGKSKYSRTLWVPAASRWSYYDAEHPRVNATSLLGTRLDNPGDKRDVPTQKDILALLHSDTFQHYLSITGTEYVVVPIRDIDNQNDFFSFYGDSRQPYVDALNALPFLEKIQGSYKELAVYRNKSYQPYAVASSTLYNMPGPVDFAQIFPFFSQLAPGAQYTLDADRQLARTNLVDAFAGKSAADYQKPAIAIDGAEAKNFYLNSNKNYYRYKVEDGYLDLYSSRSVVANEAGLHLGTSAPVLAASVPVEKHKSYFLAYQNGTVPLDTHITERDFGSLGGAVSIYAADNTNLLPNGSFEQGPWEKHVRDCDPYDSNPKIGMNHNSQDYTLGAKSLNLWALRHTACTRSASFAAAPGTYLFSFMYKSRFAEQISYRIIMDGKPGETVIRPADSTSDSWIVHTEKVTVPPGVKNVQVELRGLPPGSFSPLERFTHFDDVKFMPLMVHEVTSEQQTKPSFQKVYTSEKGKTTDVTIEVKPPGNNLVSNPSLENGLWQKEVGDCNNYDDEPRISMRSSTFASDGKHSLELRAKRHIACTGPQPITVQEGRTYMLRFNYQSPNSETARFSIAFNDASRTTQSKNLKAANSWQTYQQVVKVPLGATSLALRVAAVSDETGSAETINHYDNFSLAEVPDVLGQLFAVDEAPATRPPASITATHVASHKKRFEARGAKAPFYLSMEESYHTGWQLKGVAANQHFQAYGFMNGWRVDPATFCAQNSSSCTKHGDGSYDLRLMAEFTPHRWLTIGTILSAFVLMGTLATLIPATRRAVRSIPEKRRIHRQNK
jgi:hypothetical protein